MPTMIHPDFSGLRQRQTAVLPPILTSENIPKRGFQFMKTLPVTTNDLANLSLVISSHLPALVDTINQQNIVLVSAPTGIGKSLGIPWILGRNGNRVVVSVPTVAAATSLFARQKTLNPDIEVGYAAEAKIHYSEKTQIIYATSGHIRRRFLDFYRQMKNQTVGNDFVTRLISQTDILILDEIHLGSIDDHINQALWKYGFEQGYQIPKLVLSSATPEESKYLKTFKYSIPTKNYPVKVYYHNKNYAVGDRLLITDLANIILAFHTSPLKGDILVFVAGKSEIGQVMAKLRILLQSSDSAKPRAILVPAHGDLSHEDFRKIYRRPGFSRETGRMIENPPRKIIIATNIAETSITIEGINLVIDSILEKRSETSSTGGFRLALHHISQSSAIQRQGRTGRTGSGNCYRMCTADFFLQLEKNRPEEITRVPIYNTVMELIEVGLKPSEVLLNLDKRSIRQAVSLLTQLKLITKDGHVTEAGHFVTNFPLSVRNATTLWLWSQKEIEIEGVKIKLPLYPGVVVISLLDSYGPSYFWYPPKTYGESNNDYNQMIMSHKEEYFGPIEGFSDVETILNMWNDMTSRVGGPNYKQSEITKWAVANSINNRKFKEALRIVNQVRNSLERLNYTVQIGSFSTEGVVRQLRPLAEITYQDLIMTWTRGSQPSYYHQGSKQVYRLDQRNAVNQLTRKLPQRVIPFVMAEIHSGGSTIRLINVALDLEKIEIGSELTARDKNNLARALSKLKGVLPSTPMGYGS
uniref:ATP-dependent helicase n=1 Tax=Pithovirus LCPAC201 TaxID=2506591 RepID=A0A481Z499_9VIRU|nr:MAG: ATP-dependent helicase [Pithovirus LCPAC201]